MIMYYIAHVGHWGGYYNSLSTLYKDYKSAEKALADFEGAYEIFAVKLRGA